MTNTFNYLELTILSAKMPLVRAKYIIISRCCTLPPLSRFCIYFSGFIAIRIVRRTTGRMATLLLLRLGPERGESCFCSISSVKTHRYQFFNEFVSCVSSVQIKKPDVPSEIIQVGRTKVVALKDCRIFNKDIDESNLCTYDYNDNARLCNFDTGKILSIFHFIRCEA